MTRILGYARISTAVGQDLQSQREALEKLGAVVVFADVASGSSRKGRDQLDTMLTLLDQGDRVVVLHPDRLARDTGDLLDIAKSVVSKGAVLEIVDPSITFDGSDMMGEIMLTIFGMVGSIERHFIRARQRRGIEAARARGVYSGRRPKIDAGLVKSKADEGLGATEIARLLSISRSSVYRLL